MIKNEKNQYSKEEILDYLKEVSTLGVIDEIEIVVFEDLLLFNKCKSKDLEYVIESINLWSEDVYWDRLNG